MDKTADEIFGRGDFNLSPQIPLFSRSEFRRRGYVFSGLWSVSADDRSDFTLSLLFNDIFAVLVTLSERKTLCKQLQEANDAFDLQCSQLSVALRTFRGCDIGLVDPK
jgi:hypothetical protein